MIFRNLIKRMKRGCCFPTPPFNPFPELDDWGRRSKPWDKHGRPYPRPPYFY